MSNLFYMVFLIFMNNQISMEKIITHTFDLSDIKSETDNRYTYLSHAFNYIRNCTKNAHGVYAIIEDYKFRENYGKVDIRIKLHAHHGPKSEEAILSTINNLIKLLGKNEDNY